MKVLFGIIISLLFLTNVSASEKIEVSFSKCVDGDTAWFILNGEEITVNDGNTYIQIQPKNKNIEISQKMS